ncbi:TPA: terminase small subunit [Streptococcus suis]
MGKLDEFGLGSRQRRFADEYIATGNAYQSALKAGYPKSTAKNAKEKMVENGGKISEYISFRLEQLSQSTIATAEEAMEKLTLIIRQELTEEKSELNQITGEFVTIIKKPTIDEVRKAAVDILRRYPIALEVEKLRLEIEKLKTQVTVDNKTELALDKLFNKLEEEINGN